MVKREAVGEFAGADAVEAVRMSFKCLVHFGQCLVNIGEDGNCIVTNIVLQDAVLAAEVAIGLDIEYVIIAAAVFRCAWAVFEKIAREFSVMDIFTANSHIVCCRVLSNCCNSSLSASCDRSLAVFLISLLL